MARKKKATATPSLRREWTSPIELALRNAIVTHVDQVDRQTTWLSDYSTSLDPAVPVMIDGKLVRMDDNGMRVEDGYGDWGEGDEMLDLFGNVYLSSYKIDLLIGSSGDNVWMAIECDGHEWHDRTKQQASSDRARDREILRLGVSTIRFTGSDIHHDAPACAREVFSTLRALIANSYGVGNMAGWREGYDVGKASVDDSEVAKAAFKRGAIAMRASIYSGGLSTICLSDGS